MDSDDPRRKMPAAVIMRRVGSANIVSATVVGPGVAVDADEVDDLTVHHASVDLGPAGHLQAMGVTKEQYDAVLRHVQKQGWTVESAVTKVFLGTELAAAVVTITGFFMQILRG